VTLLVCFGLTTTVSTTRFSESEEVSSCVEALVDFGPGLGEDALRLLDFGMSFLNLKLRLGVFSSLVMLVGVADRPREELRPLNPGNLRCEGVLCRPRVFSLPPAMMKYCYVLLCCCVVVMFAVRVRLSNDQ